jgi:hypothetical protein
MSHTRNLYRASPRKWRKWSIVARGTFNKTFAMMRENPDLFRHPADPARSKKWASTTAWNAAWIAADHVDETLRDIAEG